MVTENYSNPLTVYGLSTDSKPTDASNGACFIEMNTGKVYFFDAASKTWLEWGAST